jgi:hypothetical protein
MQSLKVRLHDSAYMKPSSGFSYCLYTQYDNYVGLLQDILVDSIVSFDGIAPHS